MTATPSNEEDAEGFGRCIGGLEKPEGTCGNEGEEKGSDKLFHEEVQTSAGSPALQR